MMLLMGAILISFLSTLSLRRATPHRPPRGGDYLISIHALLAESDANSQQEIDNGHEFLSTLSLRRATADALTDDVSTGGFLSTLSLRRATAQTARNTSIAGHFYPRSPCGERRVKRFHAADISYFYPRSPCGERRQQPAGDRQRT